MQHFLAIGNCNEGTYLRRPFISLQIWRNSTATWKQGSFEIWGVSGSLMAHSPVHSGCTSGRQRKGKWLGLEISFTKSLLQYSKELGGKQKNAREVSSLLKYVSDIDVTKILGSIHYSLPLVIKIAGKYFNSLQKVWVSVSTTFFLMLVEYTLVSIT